MPQHTASNILPGEQGEITSATYTTTLPKLEIKTLFQWKTIKFNTDKIRDQVAGLGAQDSTNYRYTFNCKI